MSKVEIIHGDCMEYMATLPDKAFELAIVDPPYGIEDKISIGGGSHTKSCVKFHQLYSENHKTWDVAPNEKYFNELVRVSENQIIWGGNYFKLMPCRCFIFWDKCVEVPNFSAGEYAWTSFDRPSAKVTIRNTVEIMKSIKTASRIHPTQKPVALYQWLLKNYAKQGDKILDTHLGSGSSAIAADIMGYDFTGYEIDKDYYEAALDRFNRHKQQLVFNFAGNE